VVYFAGVKCVFFDSDERMGFTLTAAMVEPYLNARTKMVIINSPSNPSGAVMDRGEFEQILKLTAERGIYLMTDECYCKFLYDSEPFSIASLPGAKDTVLVAGSLSKTYAMTGWRMGFVLGPAAVVSGINKLQSHATSNPNSITQKAAIEALNGPQDFIPVHNKSFKERRDLVVDALNKVPGLFCPRPEGAFYVYPSCAGVLGKKTPSGETIRNDEDFVKYLLATEGVAVVHGEAFGLSPHFRVSYATSTEVLQDACVRIERACRALQ